mmetsp:Transcript_105385/g.183287  ORF Transcript_105385/g.183287 Transcript_105385/m.183287 type:complete len:507 (+) Transcript_105385:76-1596(+)
MVTAISDVPSRDFNTILQTISVIFLGLMALACVHALLYHLHSVLAPFVLAGFLVFAVEPSVEILYRGLAGLSSPYRWCCCCALRRWKRPKHEESDGSAEPEDSPSESESPEHAETEVLLGEDSSEDGFRPFMVKVLDGLCRFAAVLLVLGAMIFTLLTLVSLLARGAVRVRENWSDYQQGMVRMTAWLDKMKDFLVVQLQLSGKVDYRMKMVYTNVLSRFEDMILEVVNMILGAVTGGVYFAVIAILYMLFWLLRPLPIAGKATALVHSYIWKKTVVSSLYGSSIGLMLHLMGVDLAIFFGLVTFSLNYVPEVGALIAMIVPIPVILLDGKQHAPFLCLIAAIIGQIVLKLVFGNILELRLIQDDKAMRIHPVWVLLGLNYFGFIWGPVGMLISVPLMAMLKSIISKTAEDMEEVNIALYAQDFLACLEGRKRWREKREITRRQTAYQPPPASTLLQKAESAGQQPALDADEEMGVAAAAPKKPRPEGQRGFSAPASSAAAAAEQQ